MSSDEDATLAAARSAPIRDRCAHALWKARVEAYETVGHACARNRSHRDDATLVDFGACGRRRRDGVDDAEEWMPRRVGLILVFDYEGRARLTAGVCFR